MSSQACKINYLYFTKPMSQCCWLLRPVISMVSCQQMSKLHKIFLKNKQQQK